MTNADIVSQSLANAGIPFTWYIGILYSGLATADTKPLSSTAFSPGFNKTRRRDFARCADKVKTNPYAKFDELLNVRRRIRMETKWRVIVSISRGVALPASRRQMLSRAWA